MDTNVKKTNKAKTKRSIPLLIGAILGVIYSIYIISYFSTAISSSTSASATLGAGIATALVLPHMICTILAAIFNIIGWAANLRWSALVGGILYCLAAVMFFMYAPFVLVQIVLSFVGFVGLKKIIAENKKVSTLISSDTTV